FRSQMVMVSSTPPGSDRVLPCAAPYLPSAEKLKVTNPRRGSRWERALPVAASQDDRLLAVAVRMVLPLGAKAKSRVCSRGLPSCTRSFPVATLYRMIGEAGWPPKLAPPAASVLLSGEKATVWTGTFGVANSWSFFQVEVSQSETLRTLPTARR